MGTFWLLQFGCRITLNGATQGVAGYLPIFGAALLFSL